MQALVVRIYFETVFKNIFYVDNIDFVLFVFKEPKV